MASISIGLRAKTGRAIAVVLGGTGNVPHHPGPLLFPPPKKKKIQTG
jgi:hypothetical protein